MEPFSHSWASLDCRESAERAFLSGEGLGLTEWATWWELRLPRAGCLSLTPSPDPAAQAVLFVSCWDVPEGSWAMLQFKSVRVCCFLGRVLGHTKASVSCHTSSRGIASQQALRLLGQWVMWHMLDILHEWNLHRWPPGGWPLLSLQVCQRPWILVVLHPCPSCSSSPSSA